MNEIIIKNIYEDILELSDINMQREYWLGKSNDYVSSYVEVMCRLFDDNAFDEFVDKIATEIGLSEKTVLELIKLRTLLNSYNEKKTDREIIEDPEWGKVVNQAKTVLENWDKI